MQFITDTSRNWNELKIYFSKTCSVRLSLTLSLWIFWQLNLWHNENLTCMYGRRKREPPKMYWIIHKVYSELRSMCLHFHSKMKKNNRVAMVSGLTHNITLWNARVIAVQSLENPHTLWQPNDNTIVSFQYRLNAKMAKTPLQLPFCPSDMKSKGYWHTSVTLGYLCLS